MAVPCMFDESNVVLDKPPNMSHDDCQSLSVHRTLDAQGRPVVISCWKLTKTEIDEFLRTGRVWLIVAGITMPPVDITATKPFV